MTFDKREVFAKIFFAIFGQGKKMVVFWLSVKKEFFGSRHEILADQNLALFWAGFEPQPNGFTKFRNVNSTSEITLMSS